LRQGLAAQQQNSQQNKGFAHASPASFLVLLGGVAHESASKSTIQLTGRRQRRLDQADPRHDQETARRLLYDVSAPDNSSRPNCAPAGTSDNAGGG
jgi:hypothetical protein